MNLNVLITGGAGFIGTRLARRLLHDGCRVGVLDNFQSSRHAGRRTLSSDIAHDVDLTVGDVRDADVFHRALEGRDVVLHLAAETGSSHSMCDVLPFEDVNVHGTAILADALGHRRSSVAKVIVASSRAVYGEGRYLCAEHGTVHPAVRDEVDLGAQRFEPRCPSCGETCSVLPTGEDSPTQPASFYGLTKRIQEQMLFMAARRLGLSAWALRYQNVYGPGQSPEDPYAGTLAYFSTLARQGHPLEVLEDGLESRDFVHVEDVVDATAAAVHSDRPAVEPVNVGSGTRTTIVGLAERVIAELQSESEIVITGEFRSCDVRHAVADLRKAQRLLAFEPRRGFASGLREFLAWSGGSVATDRVGDRNFRSPSTP